MEEWQDRVNNVGLNEPSNSIKRREPVGQLSVANISGTLFLRIIQYSLISGLKKYCCDPKLVSL
jgi:hypothetical protein